MNRRSALIAVGDPAKRLTDDELVAKLSSFGVELDRPSLERLCDQALSAEVNAQPLLDQRIFHGSHEQIEKALVKPAGATIAARPPDNWRSVVDNLHADSRNGSIKTMPSPPPKVQRPKPALEQLRATRPGAVEDYRAGVEDRRIVRKVGDYLTEWRLLLADLRSEEIPGTPASVLDQHHLASLKKDINP
jgi:hypothetical protein